QRGDGNQLPAAGDELAPQPLADADEARRLWGGRRLLAALAREGSQQPRLRADVADHPRRQLAQGPAVVGAPARLAPARLAVDEHALRQDVVEEVGEDVLLHDVAAVHVGADFRVDLVPGPADARLEEAAQRGKVLVERPGGGVASGDALADGPAVGRL